MRSNLMICFLLTGCYLQSAQEMSLSLDEAGAYAVQHNTQMQTSQLNIADGRTTLQSRTSRASAIGGIGGLQPFHYPSHQPHPG